MAVRQEEGTVTCSAKLVVLAGALAVLAACSKQEERTEVRQPVKTDTASEQTLRKPDVDDNLARLVMPPGFRIELYADNIENARSLCLTENGTLFVGTRTAGAVYAVRDNDGDFHADEVFTLAEDLYMPNGVAFRDGTLYVAEVNRVWTMSDIESRLHDPPDPVVINDSFPSDRHHGWKFIRFGPDNMLYVPVGAPCNICLRDDDPRYASIMRMRPDGNGLVVFAHGIRNTVGFDWHPRTGVLWFTDNGRDRLGDDMPPDELNRAPEKDLHFGYPFYHGGYISDPEFGKEHSMGEFIPPAKNLGPHVAALGMRFYTGDMFPGEYRESIFIAEHGSWDRNVPIGYRVMHVMLDGSRVVRYQPFIEGWLQDGEAWGRPVDVEQMPDGSLLVSDDRRGCIYRVTYEDK